MAIPIVQGNLTEAYDKARYILYPEVYTPYAALHNATHKQLLAVYCKHIPYFDMMLTFFKDMSPLCLKLFICLFLAWKPVRIGAL